MEDTKYYTPAIEEFHVGFELELKLHELKNWEKHTWLPGDQASSVAKYLDQVRVKCLDREDIESFGFTAHEIRFGAMLYSGKDHTLTHFSHSKEVYVYRKNIGIEFKGKIKNRSELKQLLKQLEII